MKRNICFLAMVLALKLNPLNASQVVQKSGIYTGFALGYSQLKSKNAETKVEEISFPFTDNEKSTRTNSSLGGDVFLGYRYIFNSGFLAGLDVALSWDGNKIAHSYDVIQDDFKSKTTLSTPYKFIPGLVVGGRFLDRFLAFIKLGPAFTQFRFKHTIVDPSDGSVDSVETFSQRKVGYFGSATLEYAIDKNLSTIAVVSYEHYGTIKKTFPGAFFPATEVDTISLKPSYFSAKVGLVFRFNCG